MSIFKTGEKMRIKRVSKDSVKIHIKKKPEIHAKKRRRQKANVFAKAAKVEIVKVTEKQVDGESPLQGRFRYCLAGTPTSFLNTRQK